VSDTEQIQRDIEETREQLGETVEALAEKTDVKGQAKRKLDSTKASMAAKKDELLERAPDAAGDALSQVSTTARKNPIPMASIGAFAAGFLAGRITRR
jgi:ElaB/YqjD/DUF883 family membrane-anchored ribosome-binding protein